MQSMELFYELFCYLQRQNLQFAQNLLFDFEAIFL